MVLPEVKLCPKTVLTVPVFVAGLLTVMVWQPMVSAYVAPLPEQPLASTAWTTIGNAPICVGVPDRTPAADSVRPVGSVLAVVNVTAPMLFVVVKLWLKTTLTGPLLVAGLLTVMTWQPMVSVYAGPLAEQPLASTTCTVIGKLPVCVGVPERTPAADSVMPAGSVPLLMVNVFAPIAAGAVKLWLKGTFTVPVLVGGFVTVMGWQAMVRV